MTTKVHNKDEYIMILVYNCELCNPGHNVIIYYLKSMWIKTYIVNFNI